MPSWTPSESEQKQIDAMSAAAGTPNLSYMAGVVSGDPAAGNAGSQAMAQEAKARREQTRGLRASMEAEANRKQQLELAEVRNQRFTSYNTKEEQRKVRAAATASRRHRAKRMSGKLTGSQENDLGAEVALLQNTRDLIKTWEPNFKSTTKWTGGALQGLSDATGIGSVIGNKKGAEEQFAENAWWKRYESQIKLLERHKLFGGALTPTEQKSWEQADINRGMGSDELIKNLEIRTDLLQKSVARRAKSYAERGVTESKQTAGYLKDLDLGPDFALPSGEGDDYSKAELQSYVDMGYSGADDTYKALYGEAGGSAAPATPATGDAPVDYKSMSQQELEEYAMQLGIDVADINR